MHMSGQKNDINFLLKLEFTFKHLLLHLDLHIKGQAKGNQNFRFIFVRFFTFLVIFKTHTITFRKKSQFLPDLRGAGLQEAFQFSSVRLSVHPSVQVSEFRLIVSYTAI